MEKVDERKFWDERKYSFSLLLNCIDIDNTEVHKKVKTHVSYFDWLAKFSFYYNYIDT